MWEDRQVHQMQAMQQLAQAAQQQMNACTCTDPTNCTCGAVTGPPEIDEPEDAEDYTEWDKLMEKARDRDVILVYREGTLYLRF
jgi:hypothetical protein